MLLMYKNFPVSTHIETMGDSMLVLLKKKKKKKEIMNNIFTEKLLILAKYVYIYTHIDIFLSLVCE